MEKQNTMEEKQNTMEEKQSMQEETKPKTMIESAKEAAERLKQQNERLETNIRKLEELKAIEMLGFPLITASLYSSGVSSFFSGVCLPESACPPNISMANVTG
jgi:hypothetical protein